jgi:hypothetical protein
VFLDIAEEGAIIRFGYSGFIGYDGFMFIQLKMNTLIERGGGTGPMKPGNLYAGANTSSPARLNDERKR